MSNRKIERKNCSFGALKCKNGEIIKRSKNYFLFLFVIDDVPDVHYSSSMIDVIWLQNGVFDTCGKISNIFSLC